jgi:transcriptional regulator with XRE-family HTH domain
LATERNLTLEEAFLLDTLRCRFKFLREGQELTQKEVSQKLDLPLNDYLDYEAGDRLPDTMTILHLASFYEVSVDYVLGQTERMQRYPLT